MTTILFAWLSIALLMSLAWAYYQQTKIPGIVDVAWSVGHWLSGTFFLFALDVNARTVLLWLILTIWMARLAGYLFWTRVRVGEKDKRYVEISKQWTIAPSLGFFLNFQLQGVLIMLVVSCLYFSGRAQNTSLNILDIIGILTTLVGLALATIADLQLRNFVAQHKGQVCNQGLWRYSRHPNYFFEWLVWVGFACTALSAPYGYLAIISPLTLYLIMTQVTGPITERGSLASKGDAYRSYLEKTSMFFPLPIYRKTNDE